MNIEELRLFCLSFSGTSEDLPFNESTLAFRVQGKIFLLTNLDLFESFNVKCDPEKAILLREEHSAILPGFHMNKKHWNTVRIDGSLTNDQLKEQIKHSYNCVVKSLPKKDRMALSDLGSS